MANASFFGTLKLWTNIQKRPKENKEAFAAVHWLSAITTWDLSKGGYPVTARRTVKHPQLEISFWVSNFRLGI